MAGHRAFQYYTNGVGNVTEFFDPRIELVDGTEQGVGSMLADAALAVATAAFNTAAAAQATADGKIDSFWQTTAPGSASEGDLWFDTDDNLKQYRWTSGAWALAADTRIGTAIANAATAQATADGKIVTFVQTSAPTATAVGDLWFDSDGGYQLYRWNGSTWVPYRFDTAALEVGAATNVYSTTPSSAVTITNVATTPDNINRYTSVCDVTFTALASGDAIVYAEGRLNYTEGAGTTAECHYSVQDINSFNGWNRIDVYPIAANSVSTRQISTGRRVAITGGVTYTFRFCVNKWSSADTVTVDQSQIRVELIKI